MQSARHPQHWKILLTIALTLYALPAHAGVSREIQERYRQKYENKALFLRIPIFADRAYMLISGRTFRPERLAADVPPRFKVAEQVRVLGLDFGRDEIKFKLGAIGGPALAELIFKFDAELQEKFPNSDVFDAALQGAFSEGLKFSDLEEARRTHAQEQFERAIAEIAGASGSNRETVLGFIAPQVPAYQDAVRDVENLKKKSQELAAQIQRLQAENRDLQSGLRAGEAEVARLRSLSASLQEKIETTTSQLARIREDLRAAQGERAGYQKEIANLQRSLRLKSDAGRDPGAQLVEIAQAAQKLQKDREELESRNNALQAELDAARAANAKLSGEVEELDADLRKMRETIAALTSREDSLARRYLDLQRTKENLETLKLSVAGLQSQVVEERSEGALRTGKVDIFLGDVHLGVLEWKLPAFIAAQESAGAEVSFTAESIDYVRVAPPERALLQSLGEPLKVQVALAARSGAMEVTPGQSAALQTIGERDTAVWKWQVSNRGGEDARLVLAAGLINKNGDEIPLWKSDQPVLSSSVVRRIRGYLQPAGIAVGVLVGLLMCAIASIFRRPGKAAAPAAARPPAAYPDKKGL